MYLVYRLRRPRRPRCPAHPDPTDRDVAWSPRTRRRRRGACAARLLRAWPWQADCPV